MPIPRMVQGMTPTGRTVAGGGVGSFLAVILVVVMEMFEVPNLTPDRAAILTAAVGGVLGYVIHRWERKAEQT